VYTEREPLAMTTELIRYENITKRYGDVVAAHDVSFTVSEGEFLALLGPSGAGKTTLLRILAGFEDVTEGRIILNGEDITGVPPHKRDTGMVFQDYALFPHMSVKDNIAFGLKRHGFTNIESRIEEGLEMMEMSGMGDRKPTELSGGQQQRVATARAIAIEPSVLLMDEPLGALDKKLREQLQVDLKNLQQELGITTIYVTHNQTEALTMADRILIMNEGEIEQQGSPTEIYQNPATEFVADFIGDTNFLQGEFEALEPTPTFVLSEGQRIRINPETINGSHDKDFLRTFIRPEKITIHADPSDSVDDGETNVVHGVITDRLFLGSKIRYFVTAGGNELIVEAQTEDTSAIYEQDQEVALEWEVADTRAVRNES